MYLRWSLVWREETGFHLYLHYLLTSLLKDWSIIYNFKIWPKHCQYLKILNYLPTWQEMYTFTQNFPLCTSLPSCLHGNSKHLVNKASSSSTVSPRTSESRMPSVIPSSCSPTIMFYFCLFHAWTDNTYMHSHVHTHTINFNPQSILKLSQLCFLLLQL